MQQSALIPHALKWIGISTTVVAFTFIACAQSLDATRKLAEKGDAKAQNALGEMYRNGKGVPKDPAQAVVWIRKAAEQGNRDAENSLSSMYFTGEGITKDVDQALVWLEKAAAQGDADAQNNMGLILASKGELTKAYMWWIISAGNGNKTASENQDSFRGKFVSSNQVAEANRMAREWLASHPSGGRLPGKRQ